MAERHYAGLELGNGPLPGGDAAGGTGVSSEAEPFLRFNTRAYGIWETLKANPAIGGVQYGYRDNEAVYDVAVWLTAAGQKAFKASGLEPGRYIEALGGRPPDGTLL
jgi:hypothetical protein